MRTAIRIRGAFAARPDGGTFVEYRVEFLPVALWLLAVTTPIGLAVFGGGLWLAHQSAWNLWPAILSLWVLGAAANLWISERQAHWLVDFISHRLEVS